MRGSVRGRSGNWPSYRDRKPGIELLERTWVVNPGLWVILFIHPHILYLVATCVKWIATFRKYGEVCNNDSTLTSALLNRLFHHAQTVLIEGKSYRMKDQLDS
jgi:hypothetical protein